MRRELVARLLVLGLGLGVPLAAVVGDWLASGGTPRTVVIRGRVARDGGWTPDHLVLAAGRPVRLRLTSDDVLHGFAVGRTGLAVLEVPPGRWVERTLTLQEPGTYVFYCNRWCGPDHWRMRGTIEVRGPADAGPAESPVPLFLALGLDLDAPRAAAVVPRRVPSAARGASLLGSVPAQYLGADYYRRHSPADTWRALRGDTALRRRSDEELWDAVAAIWRAHASPAELSLGAELFSANCAACHGERGGGDGVMGRGLSPGKEAPYGHGLRRPAALSDPRRMLAASPALLYGKIQRGGMGTGMPNWGPILSDEQTWAVVAYLWTFLFPLVADGGAVGRSGFRARRNATVAFA